MVGVFSLFRFLLSSKDEIVAGRGGLVVSALVSAGSSGPGSSPGRGHRVLFLGKTLNFHIASLHPGV